MTGPLKSSSIRVDNLTMSYGSSTVFSDLSIDIESGSLTTLLGASGSGKTTLLGAISGLLRPTAGSIFIDDDDVTSMPVQERNIGMVFQNYALFPNMTVMQNVGYPLRVRHVSREVQRERVREALAMVDLEDRGHYKPSMLSGGQKQRVALARAIVFKPRILLMDEPLGALDAELRKRLQREIVRIGTSLGITIVYVTHDQEEAMSMSSMVAVFHQGRIVQYGTPEDLYRRPASPYVASFVGEGVVLSGTVKGSASSSPSLRIAESFPPIDVPIDTLSRAVAEGSRGAVVLRPGQVLARTSSDSGTASAAPEETLLGRGVVGDVLYRGDYWLAQVSVSPGIDVKAKVDAPSDSLVPGLGDSVDLVLSRGVRPALIPVS